MPAPKQPTDEMIKQAAEHTLNGLSMRYTATLIGVHEATLRVWLKDGETAKEGTPKHRLFTQFSFAQAEYNRRFITFLTSSKDWRARVAGHKYVEHGIREQVEDAIVDLSELRKALDIKVEE